MQLTETAGRTMPATMLRKDYRGRDARRAILLALRQRERDGLRTSLTDLSSTLDLPRQMLYYHVRGMRTAGLLTTTRGRYGGLALTDAGRLAADTMPES